MGEVIGIGAVIALCMVLEGALSILHEVLDKSKQTYADCMDDVAESIKQDVKRIRRQDEAKKRGF